MVLFLVSFYGDVIEDTQKNKKQCKTESSVTHSLDAFDIA